jgi:putative DNA primase/helicase
MATNYEPIIRGTDNGIWRRMVKIPFNKIFNEQQQDKDLIEKLRLEKSGILNWMVQGCLKWQKEGLVEPSVIQDEVKKYRTDMDLVSKWIDENCELDNSYSERSQYLFENFSSYCASNKEFMMSNTLFGRNIGKKFRKVRKNGVFYYVGIRLRSDI